MKGQLDISFQWIYVVIAGGAFLLIFFFVFKACTQGEEQRSNAASVKTAATMLSTAAWQPDGIRNISVDAKVSCIGGVLTLSRGDARSQIQRTPVFLPPTLNGRISTSVIEVVHKDDQTPEITYGNILYVTDESTYYYVFDGITVPARNVEAITAVGPAALNALESIDVPDGASTVIIVSRDVDLSQIRLPQTRAPVYGVNVKNGDARFYARSGAGLALNTSLRYVGDELMLGAIISGVPSTYNCSKANFAQRVEDITSVYVKRSELLMAEDIHQACKDQLKAASTIWTPGLSGDALLATMRDPRLMVAQRTLYDLNCPVIA